MATQTQKHELLAAWAVSVTAVNWPPSQAWMHFFPSSFPSALNLGVNWTGYGSENGRLGVGEHKIQIDTTVIFHFKYNSSYCLADPLRAFLVISKCSAHGTSGRAWAINIHGTVSAFLNCSRNQGRAWKRPPWSVRLFIGPIALILGLPKSLSTGSKVSLDGPPVEGPAVHELEARIGRLLGLELDTDDALLLQVE